METKKEGDAIDQSLASVTGSNRGTRVSYNELSTRKDPESCVSQGDLDVLGRVDLWRDPCPGELSNSGPWGGLATRTRPLFFPLPRVATSAQLDNSIKHATAF